MGITHIPRSGWGIGNSKPYTNNLVFRYLDTNGDGTGDKEMVGNYALSPEEFSIGCVGRIHVIHRIMVHYTDIGNILSNTYGCGITLTNGIEIECRDNDDSVLIDLLDGIPITDNDGWLHICYDFHALATLGNTKSFAARWTFAKSGSPLVLHSGQKLVARLNDDFTGLLEHSMFVQGYHA